MYTKAHSLKCNRIPTQRYTTMMSKLMTPYIKRIRSVLGERQRIKVETLEIAK